MIIPVETILACGVVMVLLGAAMFYAAKVVR